MLFLQRRMWREGGAKCARVGSGFDFKWGGVRVRLTETLFDQTHEKVWEEGEEHSKTFQNILG